MYQACVLSTLLYGSETWPSYSVQERRINSVFQRHLRTIMNITWKDHVSNHNILTKGKIPSLHALISLKRLRWLGHVTRMEDGRIPKHMLYSELCLGTRPTGRPALRFKDVCKRDMKACDIDTSSWETAAQNRITWRKITRDGMKIMMKSVNINGRKRETNHHLNLQQILPSNVITAVKSVDQGLDFTATGHAVFKNDSTEAQSPLSNMTDGCQQLV